MKSVDTNILVRLIVRDDPKQAEIADRIVQAGVYVTLTVLLELGWILSSYYRFNRLRLNTALLTLLDTESIHVEETEAVRAALDLHRAGADIADVLHLVAAKGTEAFVTFDKGVPDAEALGVDVERV